MSSARPLALVVALLLSGCARSRPPPEGWIGCVFEPAARAMEHGSTVVKPGSGSFLYAHARWDSPGFPADPLTGELEVDFPGPLAVGVTRTLARGERDPLQFPERTAAYRERWGFDASTTLEARSVLGTLRVIESDAQTVTFAVDLRPADVGYDHYRRKEAPAPLVGTLRARRMESIVACQQLRGR